MNDADRWIEALQLQPHPEGGWFRESYRSSELISRAALPARFSGDRCFSTAIYFLLKAGEFSALHRIKQDEVWHFYDGDLLTIEVIDPAGNHSSIQLGQDFAAGHTLQAVVEGGCLFGASLAGGGSYALVGCTVAPGFDFADFELPKRAELLEQFPEQREIIEKLTN